MIRTLQGLKKVKRMAKETKGKHVCSIPSSSTKEFKDDGKKDIKLEFEELEVDESRLTREDDQCILTRLVGCEKDIDDMATHFHHSTWSL